MDQLEWTTSAPSTWCRCPSSAISLRIAGTRRGGPGCHEHNIVSNGLDDPDRADPALRLPGRAPPAVSAAQWSQLLGTYSTASATPAGRRAQRLRDKVRPVWPEEASLMRSGPATPPRPMRGLPGSTPSSPQATTSGEAPRVRRRLAGPHRLRRSVLHGAGDDNRTCRTSSSKSTQRTADQCCPSWIATLFGA